MLKKISIINRQSLYLPIYLFIILSVMSFLSVTNGAHQISWLEIKNIITQYSTSDASYQILIHIRCPRVFLAIITGATFGTVGTALQALFRNPLADPSLIGVTSGAASGAALSIVVISPIIQRIAPKFNELFGIQFFSFIFALLTVSSLYHLSHQKKNQTITTMLLAGIAINAVSSAFITALSYIADNNTLRLLSLWNFGGFSNTSWLTIYWIILPCCTAIVWLVRIAPQLNLLQLGSEEALRLGVDIEYLTNQIFFFSAIAIGALTSHVGIISFIGIISPHCIRLIDGPNCCRIMPNAALFGSILAVTADLFSRTLLAPLEIPLGILTSLMGAPFFLYLLTQIKT